MGGAEVKEEGVESEDGVGNPAGNTPTPPNAGVGVSTRRTSYVMVSEQNRDVSSTSTHLFSPPFFFFIKFGVLHSLSGPAVD